STVIILKSGDRSSFSSCGLHNLYHKMKILEQYGWSHQHDILLKQYADAKFLPGRVISIKGHKYVMITTRGELEAELSGKLLFSSFSEELPVVGDWVLYLDYDTTGYIVEVLPRKNALSRK